MAFLSRSPQFTEIVGHNHTKLPKNFSCLQDEISRLKKTLREEGIGGLIHGNREKPSPR